MRAQAQGWGRRGLPGPGSPRPSPRGRCWRPPPLPPPRGGWPQPDVPPEAEARGSGQRGRGTVDSPPMGRRSGMGRAEGHPGLEVHSAGWPLVPRLWTQAPSRQAQAFCRVAAAPWRRPRLRKALHPPIPWSLLCPLRELQGPQRSVSTLVPVTRTPPQDSRGAPCVCLCVCVQCPHLGPAQDPAAPTQCWLLPCRTQRPSTRCLLRQRSAVRS